MPGGKPTKILLRIFTDLSGDRIGISGLDQTDGGWVMNGILIGTRVFFRTIRGCITTALMEARNRIYRNDEE